MRFELIFLKLRPFARRSVVTLPAKGVPFETSASIWPIRP